MRRGHRAGSRRLQLQPCRRRFWPQEPLCQRPAARARDERRRGLRPPSPARPPCRADTADGDLVAPGTDRGALVTRRNEAAAWTSATTFHHPCRSRRADLCSREPRSRGGGGSDSSAVPCVRAWCLCLPSARSYSFPPGLPLTARSWLCRAERSRGVMQNRIGVSTLAFARGAGTNVGRSTRVARSA